MKYLRYMLIVAIGAFAAGCMDGMIYPRQTEDDDDEPIIIGAPNESKADSVNYEDPVMTY